jgi:hypothetical protein
MKREEILEFVDPEAIVWDGFDDAIIGNDNNGRVVYDIDKMIEILSNDMTEEEALEYLEFNVLCAYVGELTPVHIYLRS